MAQVERMSYRIGFVARLEEAAHLPAITIEAADLREDVLALLDHHLLDLAGRPTAIRTRAISFHPLSWASSR